MKTNGMGKRILIFTLIAVIVLTMQGPRVFAESLKPESLTKISEGQPENQPETTEEETVSQNDLPKKESVSRNDLAVLQSENGPAVTAEQTDPSAYPELTDAILEKCKVPSVDPPGVTVYLFDYWQDERGEIAHDQEYASQVWYTYKMGISEGHLLRFGYTCPLEDCKYCKTYGYFGEWNNSQTGRPYQGIVKNNLVFGFPVLNLDTLDTKEEFGGYTKIPESEEYLNKKNESLAYLFSPGELLPAYKAIYDDVQGLFQMDKDGYYYYNSTENFASYDKKTKSFILYNSPGVAEASTNKDSCGQFFPFNTAKDVFDTYTTDANENYHLFYVDKKNDSNGDEKSYNYPVLIDDNSYLYCSATRLNHFLGMTLEFFFQQPENGCMPNGKQMTFEFTGDDDVWIFIDTVLVADLGGLHGACSLDIDFATGIVTVDGKEHTLLDSFKAAYKEDPNLKRIVFRDDIPTFADDTEHTLKMFYLERGHGASDLALKFNVQTIPDEPVKKDPPHKDPDKNEAPPSVDTDESEESASDPVQENTSEPEESILSVNDNYVMLDTTGIPRTGDDSRIEWLIALCIISVLGIGAAVCKIIFIRRKQENHSSKQ